MYTSIIGWDGVGDSHNYPRDIAIAMMAFIVANANRIARRKIASDFGRPAKCSQIRWTG